MKTYTAPAFFAILMTAVLLAVPSFSVAQEYSRSSQYPVGFHVVPSPSYGFGEGTTGGNAYGGNSYGQPIASGLSVSCTASPLSARTGETVFWYSSVTGGAGGYQYFWNGTDGLTGNTSSVQRSYAIPGSKAASVTVTSGTQSVTVGCVNTVEIQPATSVVSNTVGVSCYAAQDRIEPGDAVTWLAVTSGPVATTTAFKWDGSENLTGSGPATVKTYTTNGTKQAIVTMTTQNQTIVSACTNKVTVGPRVAPAAPAQKPQPIKTETVTIQGAPAPLQGVCAPSLAQVKIKEPMYWQATAIGGIGSYTFSWSGDEDLTGLGTTTVKAYETDGTKSASVVIESGDQTTQVNCAPKAEVWSEDSTGLLAGSLFSGITGPFFLILAVLFAIILGVWFARRRQKLEEEKEGPPPQIPTFKPKTEGESHY